MFVITSSIPGTFHNDTAVEFGVGIVDRLPAVIGSFDARRVLLVSDPGLAAAGVVDRVANLLRGSGIDTTVFTDLDGEPDVKSVRAGVTVGRGIDAGVVVGLGGGSALDAAKAIGVMLSNGGDIKDYAGLGKIPLPGKPVVALPTTAGTGSEVTIWSVLSESLPWAAAIFCPG